LRRRIISTTVAEQGIEVSKDELENDCLESARTIDIDEFVPKRDPPALPHPSLLFVAGRQSRTRRLRSHARRFHTFAEGYRDE
jgi:hypothetical protein